MWGTDLTKMTEQFLLLPYLAAPQPSVSHLTDIQNYDFTVCFVWVKPSLSLRTHNIEWYDKRWFGNGLEDSSHGPIRGELSAFALKDWGKPQQIPRNRDFWTPDFSGRTLSGMPLWWHCDSRACCSSGAHLHEAEICRGGIFWITLLISRTPSWQ